MKNPRIMQRTVSVFNTHKTSGHPRGEVMNGKGIRRITIIVFCAFVLNGCRSFDMVENEKQKHAIDQQVPNMTLVVNKPSIKACFANWQHSIVTAEVGPIGFPQMKEEGLTSDNLESYVETVIRNNFIMQSNNHSNKYLSVIVRNIDFSQNWWWEPVTFGGILGILGIPVCSQTLIIEMEAAVLQQNGNILKIYKTKAEKTAYGALYWGYMWIGRASFCMALNNACADLREQIRRDADYLKSVK